MLLNDSILITIKKLLGLDGDYSPFDTDIIVLINSAFFTLKQLGIGPKEGFVIIDGSETFGDFIKDPTQTAAVQTYLFLKVKIIWDANSLGSSYMKAIQDQITELEHRLIIDNETILEDIEE